ncbi:hypothetical protein BGZ96_010388 [Linnemannia gamsii]|uniref:Zinc finger GRF-type domain-containing protein n=1 Tax=Linnemannia gamsii TaxID=64522 RepID=A0ABQ7JUK7_9FUNG|nr:hypothetical protein BGZ96_010388 [Linnemannia gamsii]
MSPKCTDYFKCSLPKEEQTNKHEKRYHGTDVVIFNNMNPSLAPIKIQRDPSKGMYYHCSHIDCDHLTIRSCGPRKHYSKCKFLNPYLQPVATTSAAATSPPPSTQSQRQNQRSHLYPKIQPKQTASSPFSTSSRFSSPEPVADNATPGNRPFLSDSTYLLRHLLKSVDRLTGTVAKLDKRLDKQTENIKRIKKKVDSLIEQVDELWDEGEREEEQGGSLAVAEASLENHNESLFIDMDLMKTHLGDLYTDTRDLREQVSGVRADIERLDLDVNTLRGQLVYSW